MENKKLNDEELMSVNGGISDGYGYEYLVCPSCQHRDKMEKFFVYNKGDGCDEETWRICPSCQYHFRTN